MDTGNGQPPSPHPSASDRAAAQLPAGVTEGDVLDLVEGTLPRDREAAVIGALRARPELAVLVEALREDRVETRAIPATMRAPAGLVDAIEGRLVHEALGALAAAESATEAIPFRRADVYRTGRLHAFLESPWTRRLATAASLSIVAGLGVWATREVVRAWPRVPQQLVNRTGPALPEPAVPDAGAGLGGETTILAAAPAEGDIYGPPAELAGWVDPDSLPMTVARAAELAAEGRLVVTMRTVDTPGLIRRMEGLIRVSPPDVEWRAWVGSGLGLLPVEYASLTMPSRWPELSEREGEFTRPTAPRPVVIAGEGDGGERSPTPSLFDARLPPMGAEFGFRMPRPVVRAVYRLRMPAGERDLGVLLRELGATAGKGREPELRELDVPILEPLSLEPESVLWWSAAPGTWARRATVPVVIETVE